jgi:hypothetical protein
LEVTFTCLDPSIKPPLHPTREGNAIGILTVPKWQRTARTARERKGQRIRQHKLRLSRGSSLWRVGAEEQDNHANGAEADTQGRAPSITGVLNVT